MTVLFPTAAQQYRSQRSLEILRRLLYTSAGPRFLDADARSRPFVVYNCDQHGHSGRLRDSLASTCFSFAVSMGDANKRLIF